MSATKEDGLPIRPTPPADGTHAAWLEREAIFDRFETAWGSAGQPPIAAFLPPGDDADRLQVLAELVRIDMDHRWRRRERALVEDYLEQFPELAHGGLGVRELLAAEIEARRVHRCPLTEEELRQRHPDHAVEFSSRLSPLVLPADATPPSAVGRIANPSHATQDLTAGAPAALAGKGTFPERLGRYQLRGPLGRGGFATVYRAWDPQLEREVAIKVPHPELQQDGESQTRLLREASSAARLRHPAIVPIHEVVQDGPCYIVYEYIPGSTLAQLLGRTTPAPEQAAAWVARLAEALDYAHRCGIIHRDIKPANIMMDRDVQPMLADFGLARQSNASGTVTQEGAILGTPAYMSPEQAVGQSHTVDARTDVYSLGVVLYELLSGQLPFQGSPMSILNHILHDEAPPPRRHRPGIPVDLETICLKAMAKEPRRRYAGAAALADDLHRFLEHRPINARRTGPVGRLILWCRRKPALAATIAIAVAVSLTVAAVSFLRVLDERDRYRAERQTAVTNLYHSLVGEGRALRLARALGYRAEVWKRLDQAHQLDSPARDLAVLRQEAVHCLGDFIGLEPQTWAGLGNQEDYVVGLASDPKSRQVALGLFNGKIVLRDLASGEENVSFKAGPYDTGIKFDDPVWSQRGITALAFASAGQKLITGDSKGQVIIWRRSKLRGWKKVRTLTIPDPLLPQTVQSVSLALTPGEKRLLVLSRGAREVAIWDLANDFKATPLALPEAGSSLALSPDGRWLAVSIFSDTSSVHVWDLPKRKLVHKLQAGIGLVHHCVFSGNGKHLACAGDEGLALFDGSDFHKQTFLRGDAHHSVAFSPDSRLLAIPSHQFGQVRLWDVSSNLEVALLKHPGEPHTVVFTPDGGSLLAASAHEVRIWNLRGCAERMALVGHHGPVNSVAFHPEDSVLASAGADGTVRLWDLSSGTMMGTLKGPSSPVQAIVFSPDGRTLAGGEVSGAIRLWDLNARQQPLAQRTLPHDLGANIGALAFSRDGGLFAAKGEKGAQVWRVLPRSGKAVRSENGDRTSKIKGPVPVFGPDRFSGPRFVPHTRLKAAGPFGHKGINSDLPRLDFDPTGTYLAYPGGGDSIGMWDLARDRKARLPAALKVNCGTAFSFLPGRERLAVLNPDKKLEVWDLAAQERLCSFKTDQLTERLNWYLGHRLAVNKRGTLAALNYSSVPILDLRTRQRLFALPKEAGFPQCLEWGPRADLLAIGSADGSIVIWNLPLVQAQLRQIGLGWDE